MEKRLGKGLDALISQEVKEANMAKAKEKVNTVKLKDIVPNPFQPRQQFSREKMTDLVNSIREKGVIQPVLVRPVDAGYELIAGERRWRAARELNINEIPVIVRKDVDDASSLEISIIENVQREELNPVEEARAYKELVDQFEYTLDKVGQMVGKDKTTISNSIRLLMLSPETLSYLEEGKLSAGHAKVILGVTSPHKRKQIAELIVKNGLSVRETEQIVQRISDPQVKKARKPIDPEVARVQEELQHKLGTKVRIFAGKKRGKIEIQYFSNDDLQRLIDIILT